MAQRTVAEQSNPLVYDVNRPIDFARVQAGHVGPATRLAIARTKAQLAKLYAVSTDRRTFNNTLRALDEVYSELNDVSGCLNLLSGVSPDAALRDSANQYINQVDSYVNAIKMDERLYRAVNAYAQTNEAQKLTGYKKRFLTKTVQEFERKGFALSADKRQELKTHFDRESQLITEFYKNLGDYTDSLIVTEAEMAGLPDDYRQSRRLPDGRYRIGVDDPSYRQFMAMAESESTRKALYLKYERRAAAKNLDVLQQTLIERKKIAKLLGYRSYAQYATADRMAKTPETVWSFIEELDRRGRNSVQSEMDTLRAIKQRYLKNDTIRQLNRWDQSFYNRLLLKEKYKLDHDQLKAYFTLDQTISSLFFLIKTVFGVDVKEVKQPSVWHPTVRLYEFRDGGKPIAYFYLDPFVRKDKQSSGAYATSIITGKQTALGYRKPMMAVVCNFAPPTAERPTLLRHGEVETLYHEFGHMLHEVLTKAPLSAQAGMSVATDFVETPSQFLENWVWNYDVLKRFARHYKTGEMLPPATYQKMLAAQHVNPGMWITWGTYSDILDMTLHDRYDPESLQTTTDVVREIHNKFHPYPYTEDTYPQAAFIQLMGYRAAYYSYDWSLVYAQDFFSVFEKEGVLNPAAGRRYRRMILEKGDTEDPAKLVRSFLGREPNQDAFLRWLGIRPDQQSGRVSGSK